MSQSHAMFPRASFDKIYLTGLNFDVGSHGALYVSRTPPNPLRRPAHPAHRVGPGIYLTCASTIARVVDIRATDRASLMAHRNHAAVKRPQQDRPSFPPGGETACATRTRVGSRISLLCATTITEVVAIHVTARATRVRYKKAVDAS